MAGLYKMIRIFTVSLVIVLCWTALSAVEPVFSPADTEISSDPRRFLELVKAVFDGARKEKETCPGTWEDIIPDIEKKLKSNEHLSAALNKPSGAVLKSLNPRDGKTLFFLYRIIVTKNGYTVHSENTRNEQNWIISSEEAEPWWYFSSSSEELEKIREKEYYLSGESTFIPGSKDRRRDRQLIVWKFHHQRAFDVLFRYTVNPREDYNFRINAAKALVQMPALTRFKNKIPEIDRIIKTETGIKNWDDDWRRKNLVEVLNDLKKRCAAKTASGDIKTN